MPPRFAGSSELRVGLIDDGIWFVLLASNIPKPAISVSPEMEELMGALGCWMPIVRVGISTSLLATMVHATKSY